MTTALAPKEELENAMSFSASKTNVCVIIFFRIASWLPPGRSRRLSIMHIVHELMHEIHPSAKTKQKVSRAAEPDIVP